MTRFPHYRKLITLTLIIIVITLTFPAIYLGNQVIEAQKKVNDLKNQITYLQNTSDTLQNQEKNLTNQIGQLQNSTDNITLTVVSIGPWHGDPLTGYPYYKFINLTLQNGGVRNIGGMILDSKVEGNTSDIGYLGIYVNSNKGVLHPNESMNMTMQLIAPTDATTQVLMNYRLAITVMLDKNILDKKTITLGD
jgi:hypothetical protein